MKTKEFGNGEIICHVTSPDFQEWLFLELENRNWSQRDLAKHAKISQGAISHVINGARQPGADFCLAIAKAFDVPAVEVFQRAGILPPEYELDERTRQMIYIFEQLTPQEQDMYIAMGQSTVGLHKKQTRGAEG